MTEPRAAPSYTEFVAALRREGETLLTAAGQGLEASVPNCEDWDVAGLVRHVSKVYNRTQHLVAERITQKPESSPQLPDGAPLDVFSELLDELVATLSDAEPDTPVWNWATGQPDVAAFWARRMAHESSVHRVDAQQAHGISQPIDGELARDGVEELLDVIGPRIYERDSVGGPEGTVALESADNGTWYVALAPGSISRADVTSSPAATVRGTTSTLLLAAYGRVPWSVLDVDGDVAVLEHWANAMNF